MDRKLTIISALVAALCCAPFAAAVAAQKISQPLLGNDSAPLISVGKLKFKDLNRDGTLNPYEDWRLPTAQRAADLVQRMTLAEKAGAMMHGTAPAAADQVGYGSRYDIDAARTIIADDHINSLITRLSGEDPAQLARENNRLQQIAEQTRLGIPITVSTDPRNSWQGLVGISNPAGKFSQWPEAIGFAAAGSETLVRDYANYIRQEYRAVGITEALSPQADIASEPRWARISGTFGEEPELARKLVRGYIEGMQNGAHGLNSRSVAAVVKHWVGYGAAEDGWDGHNAYGKNVLLADASLQQHITPFKGAFEVNVAAVMPTYSILRGVSGQGRPLEPVAAGFNRYLLTDLLRGQYRFSGVIISDWLITNDCDDECVNGSAPDKTPAPGGMPWGVESLTKQQRFVKAVQAGIDQFGGVTDTALLVDAVNQGLITPQRIDASVERIMQQKFALGLFEQPYVDAEQAAKRVGDPQTQKMADAAQFRSLVLLQNKNRLPLKPGTKVWLQGASQAAAEQAGLQVVTQPELAEVAIIRTGAPFEQPHYNYFFGRRHHEGSLAFTDKQEAYRTLQKLHGKLPVVVSIYMERPAILSNIMDKTSAVIVDFGLSDEVFFSRLLSDAPYRGRMPFALPASMQSVLEQQPGVPDDLKQPLFTLGYGLSR